MTIALADLLMAHPLLKAPRPLHPLRLMLGVGLVFSHGLSSGMAWAGAPSGGGAAKHVSPVACQLNKQRGSCLITPAGKEGLRIQFKGGTASLFVFTPAGPPTTLNRAMRDAKGRFWLMTGHHSFTLRQVGGNGDVIQVTAP
jgi:hypothetical protein